MKRVLVTGAAGFIGRHALAPLHARGYEVHAVSSRAGNSSTPRVRGHEADLLDGPAIAGLMDDVKPSHLLHFAWLTTPGVYWSSPENDRWLESWKALMRHFQRHGGTRIVMAGSCAEYEWGGTELFTEGKTALRPGTHYGECKNQLQEELASFSKSHGLSAAWGRIFFVYGHGEHPSRLVASLVTAMLQGEEAKCSDGLQVRDFLHVQDVAEAFVSLLDSGVQGSVNISSGKPVAVRDVVLAAADCVGKRDLLRIGVLPRQPHEPSWLVGDATRLTKEVGFTPRYDLATGMAQAVGEWKRELGK